MLDRLGITDEIKSKTKFPPAGGNATGEPELAIQQRPEIMNAAGVDVVGPLPADLNKVTAFAAGVVANSKSADAAKALIKFLQSPDAIKMLKASGFDVD